ncbi:lytic murein transglycosylase B [Amphritea japonica]|uniref:Membrane-bound lytic murein transglycosylase B n=1 Tax=Amphritea japonica ATCC BAA-1530 TaxID=1278309 RepID=A0A7R6SR96_9GAMM|nr:lytic murein transglycosylase B [Amphritea japonica]BBB25019.1 membrane-bound lytic murein transglycosylase B [Amphritea japonica ATCC BAA-1530]
MFKAKVTGLLAGVVLSVGFAGVQNAVAHGYGDHPRAQQFISDMGKEGFDEGEIRTILRSAERQESILKAISRPAEKRLNWGEYRNIFLKDKRINQGVEFWKKHKETLQRAEAKYGVPAEIIVAIIGVETRYGRNMGSYRVIDSLATLGFDYPPRGKFFKGQLKEYFYLLRDENVDPFSLKGSYAGAMGFGQFIPSSFRSFAVDFDGDGKKDIWNNPVDAIGSVANYFNAHGWKADAPVRSNVVMRKVADETWINAALKPEITLNEWSQRGIKTRQGLNLDDKATLLRLESKGEFQHWFGLHNFYVITRYNHSRLYAMAVYELSQAVAKKHSGVAG